MSFSRQIASSDVTPLADFTGYIVGNWYIGYGVLALSAGAAPGAGSIRIYPAFVKQTITINALGLKLTTLGVGNIQAAVYAANLSTGRPTGNAIASTASMNTNGSSSANSAVSVQLTSGLYWFASNCDNGTAVCASTSLASPWISESIGSATQANALAAGAAGLTGLTVAQTFGTWPDLTSASFTEFNGNSIPVIQFKVASIP